MHLMKVLTKVSMGTSMLKIVEDWITVLSVIPPQRFTNFHFGVQWTVNTDTVDSKLWCHNTLTAHISFFIAADESQTKIWK